MKKLTLITYLVFRGSKILLMSNDLQGTCEYWNSNQDTKVVFVTNEDKRYNIKCELQEKDLISVFGKWTFEII